jgi:hypothetical protein
MPLIIAEVEHIKGFRKEAADAVCLSSTGFQCRPLAVRPRNPA